MATKTLYVTERDLPVWQAAKRIAQQRRISESQLVREALEDYLPRLVAEPDPAERWAQLGAKPAA